MGGLHLPVSLRVLLIVCRMTKRMCVSLLSPGPVPGFQVHGSLLFTTQCMCLNDCVTGLQGNHFNVDLFLLIDDKEAK
jgi:hypothetical protein